MFELVPVADVEPRSGQFVPPLLESLVAASRRGDNLVAHVTAIAASFGFDSFEYGASTSARPDRHGANYVYSTVPEWTMHYARMGYVETDPRVFLPCKSAVPVVWDQASVRGLGPRVDAFVDDARRHGIASGVSFAWRSPQDTHVVVAFNSRVESNDDIRTKAVMRNLPDIFLFGRYFHELLMAPALERGRPARAPLPALSARELECLALAANGLTTRDISHRLEISSRTVQFHFEKIYSKLRASNRQEAVARGVQAGIVSTADDLESTVRDDRLPPSPRMPAIPRARAGHCTKAQDGVPASCRALPARSTDCARELPILGKPRLPISPVAPGSERA